MAFPVKRVLLGLGLFGWSASPVFAGPPFYTDDPQPTDLGHWEIYNFAAGAHEGSELSGEAGVDLNYGGAQDLQLTAVLPLGFDSDNDFSKRSLRGGPGVIELAIKFKMIHADDKSWLPDVSVFPRFFIPTDNRFGTGRIGLLLPMWSEKDFGPWQVFGGGGYQINPGADQRNFWQGGVTVNRTISQRLQLGVELFGQTRSALNGPGYITLNFGTTVKLVEHWSLLASAGPTWEQKNSSGKMFYLSLKADY